MTEPSSVQPGATNGGGGAVYVYGAAVSSVTLSDSSFSSWFVLVASGYVGSQDEASYSAGGALAVDVPGRASAPWLSHLGESQGAFTSVPKSVVSRPT